MVGNKAKYLHCVVDLGTGDGRFVYKSALAHPNTLYIGVDPSKNQLEIYKKRLSKMKLANAKLIVGSVENPPAELSGSADVLYVFLPWGTLLQSIVKPTTESIKRIAYFLKPGAGVEILLGYSPDSEPSESLRLELPEISLEYLKATVVPVFTQNNFTLLSLTPVLKQDISLFETTWSKKLRFGRDRPLFLLKFKYL